MDRILGILGSGWKTTFGAIGTIVLGIAGMVIYLSDPDSPNAIPPTEAVALITVGLSMLGLGDKQRRTIAKLENGKHDTK